MEEELLDLSNKQFDMIPLKFLSHIAEKQVSNINLRKNKLKTFKLELENCDYLRQLNLSFNHLNHFPHVLEISNLSILNISNNSIEQIPDSINTLISLRELDISSNSLRQLPMQVFDLPNLERLFANQNYITQFNLPDTTEKKIMQNLTELDLSKNKLQFFPDLHRIQSLKILVLRGNKINEIRIENPLKDVTSIDLANNEISSVPSSLFFFPNLETLDLCYNKISSLDFGNSENKPNLKIISLSNNKLKGLPESKIFFLFFFF